MLEALRRDTLKWEKITLRDKHINSIYSYDDGSSINYANTLALKGEINLAGLGYCEDCRRIFNKRDYEKHITPTASLKRCSMCAYCGEKDYKYVKTTHGEIVRKSSLECTYGINNRVIQSGMECSCDLCTSPEFVKLTFDMIVRMNNTQPIIPTKILTIKAFKGWRMDRIRSDYCVMYHPNETLGVRIDKNGYFVRFIVRGTGCLYLPETDNVVFADGSGSFNVNSEIKNIMRGLYNNAV